MTEVRPLQASRSQLQAGFDAGDTDALSELVTEDVVWRVAGLPPWVGQAEVLARLREFFDRFDYRFLLENTRLDTGGDRAVERSNFVSLVSSEEESDETEHSGSVVILWIRDEAVWKVAAYLDVGASLFT